jgi:RNA polymerase sigma factor (sigma-70 family)
MLGAEATRSELAHPATERRIANRHDLQARYLDDIHRYVSLFIANSDEADDVSMEVLHAAFHSFGKVRKQDNPRLWILGISRRKVADHLRKAYRRKEVSLDLASQISAAQPSIASMDVRTLLDRLQPIEAEALLLKYGMGLTQEEVACVLRKSVAAINSLLQRARAKFIELESANRSHDERNL